MNFSYKEEHEQFVSGHEGTSYIEASAVFITIVAVCLLRDSFTILLVPFPRLKNASITSSHQICRRQLIVDFILLVMPNLLNVTMLSNYVFGNLFVIIVISSLGFFYHSTKGSQKFSLIIYDINLGKRKSFITNFRSLVNLITAICILAVDFRVFPRRFAKAETYGYSIMDIGVGFYVVSNAIVSPEARSRQNLQLWRQQIKKAVLSSLPLIILGIVRFLSVKGVDYHEHVSEYGVHWNFFFTLAGLKILCSIMHPLSLGSNPLLLGAVATTLHQFCLCQGLSDYIIKGSDGRGGRNGLIDANREGIISLPGYFAIYMMSVQLGSFLFSSRHNIREWLVVVFQLLGLFAISTLLMHGVNDLIQPVSRRFSNAAYVFYVIGQSCLVLSVTLIAEILTTCVMHMKAQRGKNDPALHSQSDQEQLKRSEKVPTTNLLTRRNLYDQDTVKTQSHNSLFDTCLLDAISFNSLLFFLIANLLTGLVNMSISTIHASHMTSMLILIVYISTLCLMVSVLHHKRITTKIW